MAYGKISQWYLSQIVGQVGGAVVPVTQLVDVAANFALFTADPLVAADPLAVEIQGGTYGRPDAAWTQYNPTGIVNRDDIGFYGIPAGIVVTSVGVFDDVVNGNLVGADNFDTPLTFPTGGSWQLPAGEFFLGFDLTGL